MQNRHGAVKLLGDKNAHQLVGPRHLAKAHDGIGAGMEGGIEPVGAADRDHEITFSHVAEGAEKGGEALRIQRLATFVEKQQQAAFGHGFFQHAGFLALAGIGAGGAAW